MDLLDNPFYLLGATPRDSRQRINHLAEEMSLLLDEESAEQARADLSHPRKRLAAELGWFPGTGPARASELLTQLQQQPQQLLALPGLNAITRCNLLAAALRRLRDASAQQLLLWMTDLAQEYAQVRSDDVLRLINEDRGVSGFPEISDAELVATLLAERRYACRQAIVHALEPLPSRTLVDTLGQLVSNTTRQGRQPPPALIADLVDFYELEAQTLLASEHATIVQLADKIIAGVALGESDDRLEPTLRQLMQVAENWRHAALPIQQIKTSQGLNHDASLKTAGTLRDLSLNVFNQHDRLELAQQLTTLLQHTFSAVPEVAELGETDAKALDGFAREREAAQQEQQVREAARDREISWQGDIGMLFKQPISISAEGVRWEGRLWPLDEISRFRWGGISNSVNGIPTGTKYTITFGHARDSCSIKIRKKETYAALTDRLWRTVGVRMLTEGLMTLKNGGTLRFGPVQVTDGGIQLQRKRFMASAQNVFVPWRELTIGNGPGVFVLGHRHDSKLQATLSYLEMDNIHLLEAAIRLFWQKGGEQISSLLDN